MIRKTIVATLISLAALASTALVPTAVRQLTDRPSTTTRVIARQQAPSHPMRVSRIAATEGELQAALSVQGGVAQKTVWSENFDNGITQWTITQGPENSVNITTKAASTPFSTIVTGDTKSLYLEGDYRTYKRDIASITGPEVEVPTNGVLHFYVGCSLNFEDMSSLQALVSTDGFETEGTLVWWSRNQEGERPWQWRPIDVDLAEFAGQTIKIRFTYTYGTGDDTFKKGGYMGEYYIDGLSISGVESVDHVDVATGEVVNFVDMSQGEPVAWQWEFPGGTPESSTEVAPAVYYTVDGSYDVTLTVTDADGNASTVTREGFVNVTGQAPVAHIIPPTKFRFDDTHLPMQVPLVPTQYRDGSTGFPTEWAWTFTDNSESVERSETSTEQNPWMDYLNGLSVTQDVALTVSNQHGTSTDKQQVSVEYQGYISNLLPDDYPTVYSLGDDGSFPGDNKMGITAYAERFDKPARPIVVYGAAVFFETASAEELTDQIADVGVHLVGADENGMPDMNRKLDSMWWRVFELETNTSTTLRGTLFEFNSIVVDEDFYVVVDGIPEHNETLDVSFCTAALRDHDNTAYILNKNGWRPATGYLQAGKGTSFYIMPLVAYSVMSLLPVGTEEIEVPATAGEVKQQIFALFGYNTPIESDADWCRVTNTPNDMTLDELTIEFDALPAGVDERTATLTITDRVNATTITLRVVQRAQEVPSIKGDVNGDGEVTSADLSIIVNIIAGLEENETFLQRADVNGDGEITAIDISEVVNIIAGIAEQE